MPTLALRFVAPALAGLLLSLNLFGFPRFKEDEGEITGQAFGILHASLQPAVFGYHHSPAVPLQLAAWLAPAGHLPGLTVIETARLAMVLVAVITCYLVGRLAAGAAAAAAGPVPEWQGVAAGLVVATSPLLLLYGRWVLPDPFSALWLLGSVLVLSGRPAGDARTVAAGLLFGIAVLSKEIALVGVPALALLAWPGTGRGRRLALLAGAGLVPVAVYLVWAAGQGSLLGSGNSVAGGMLWQAGRQHDGGLLNPGSHFYQVAGAWFRTAPLLVGGSLLAGVWLAFGPGGTAGDGSSMERGIGVLALCFWAFFASGLIVQDYYVMVALPFWSAATVISGARLIAGLGRPAARESLALGAAGAVAIVTVGAGFSAYSSAFGDDYARGQRRLLDYERTHLDASAVVVDDGTDSLDLRYDTRLAGHTIDLACNYWNRWCLQPGRGPVYVVLDGELDFLAQSDPGRFADLARKAHQGRRLYEERGLSGGDYLVLVRLADQPAGR